MRYHYIGATGHQHTGLMETSIYPFDAAESVDDAAESVEAQSSRIADSIVAYALMFWALASVGGLVGILCYCLMEDFGRGGLIAVSIAYVVGWGAVSIVQDNLILSSSDSCAPWKALSGAFPLCRRPVVD